MYIKTWGTRGSCTIVQSDKLEYGGNTICYEIIHDDYVSDEIHNYEQIIVDAGTGIVELGDRMPESGKLHIFISHWHLDHVSGLSFFKPLHSPNWEVNLYLPQGQSHLLDTFFNGIFFPLKTNHLKCKLNIHELDANVPITINDITIEAPLVPHGGICHGIKAISPKGTAVILSDVEISPDRRKETKIVQKILYGAKLCFVDSYFTMEEYKNHVGWGHPPMEYWLDILEESSIEHIVFTHHNIKRSDSETDALARKLEPLAAKKNMKLSFAKETLRYGVEHPDFIYDYIPVVNSMKWINEFSIKLLSYTDTYFIVDSILAEARRITFAEAGTAYLVDGDDLVFSYTHNDKLFADDKASKHSYSNTRIPISPNSIAGYCAYTKKIVNLHDVRDIPSEYPFTFNDSFDKATNYYTKSVLCVPLLGHGDSLLGVIQLINRQEQGKSVAFPKKVIPLVSLLATQTASVIERAKLIEEMAHRLHHITSLHDPNETGAHVERVGAISAEIYSHIAAKRDDNIDQSHTIRGQIRLAAKLHDVGKVGIPKEILKKPGKLNDEERLNMQRHAFIGANIFSLAIDSTDTLIKNIAMHHHQKWNGEGYSGDESVPILKGEQIPLEARIVAVADVFDALISKRSYKPEWTWEDAIRILKEDSGSHFDPQVVEAFCEIEEIIVAIYQKYKDEVS